VEHPARRGGASKQPVLWYQRSRKGLLRVTVGLIGAGGVLWFAAPTAWAAPPPGGTDQVSQTLSGLVSQLVQAVSTLAQLVAQAVEGASPGFTGPWFGKTYLSMVLLGSLVAIGTVVFAAGSAAVGRDSSALKTMALRLPAVAFGIVAAPTVLRSINDALGQFSAALVGLSGSTPSSAASSISNSATSLGAGSQLGLFNAIVLVLVVAALTAWWVVAVLRVGVLYLTVVSIPVSASASIWGAGRAFLRRSLEVIVGFTVGQIPMGLAFSLAAAVVGKTTVVPTALANTSGDAGILLAVAILVGLGAASPFFLTHFAPVTRLEQALESRSESAAPIGGEVVANASGYQEILSERLSHGEIDDPSFGAGSHVAVLGAWRSELLGEERDGRAWPKGGVPNVFGKKRSVRVVSATSPANTEGSQSSGSSEKADTDDTTAGRAGETEKIVAFHSDIKGKHYQEGEEALFKAAELRKARPIGRWFANTFGKDDGGIG
jgi:hypothetical protein